jgi:hypothetical protein
MMNELDPEAQPAGGELFPSLCGVPDFSDLNSPLIVDVAVRTLVGDIHPGFLP